MTVSPHVVAAAASQRTEQDVRASRALSDFMASIMSGADIVAKATSYTDYIAATIYDAFKGRDPEGIVSESGRVKWDLHPTEGYLLSTKKTLEITDRNGNRYLVTVEDAR